MNSRLIIIAITLLVIYYVYDKISNLENKVMQLEHYIINNRIAQAQNQNPNQPPPPVEKKEALAEQPNNQPNQPNQLNQEEMGNVGNLGGQPVLKEEQIEDEESDFSNLEEQDDIHVYKNIENQFAEAVETKYDDSEEKILDNQPQKPELQNDPMDIKEKDFDETVNNMLSGMQDFFREEEISEPGSESQETESPELQYEESENKELNHPNKPEEVIHNLDDNENENENENENLEIITYSNENSSSSSNKASHASEKKIDVKSETATESSSSSSSSTSELNTNSSSSSSSSSQSTSSRGRKRNPYSKSNLMKRGVADLRKLATEMGIETEVHENGKKKNKTKKDLCQEINSIKSSRDSQGRA